MSLDPSCRRLARRGGRRAAVTVAAVLAAALAPALPLPADAGHGGAAHAAAFLGVGSQAPDFVLRDQHGRTHRLASFRGRPVVLAFIVRSFTGG